MTPPAASPGEQVTDVALVRGVGGLSAEVRGLRDVVTSDRRTKRWLVGILAVVLAALIIVGTIGGVAVSQLLGIGRQNRDNGRILVECTTAGNPAARNPADRVHECFDAAQANQQQAVRQIVDANHNGVLDTEEILAFLHGRSTTTTTADN